MLSHNEAQELHRLIGSALTDLSCTVPHAPVSAVSTELETALTRALELAAVIVSDTMEGVGTPTPDTSINVYFTGDEDGPDLFGVAYDDEDSVLESAHENEVHGWRVPVLPLLDRAVRLDGDPDE